MSSDSNKSAPWRGWAQRDDRAYLQALAAKNFAPSSRSFEALSEVLETIVTSLHFGSHSRRGLEASKETLAQLQNEFLKWMQDHREWQHIQKLWLDDAKGPWSLPLYLSRSYLRFRDSQHPDVFENERSESGHRKLLELPHPKIHERFADSISAPLLDAFSSMTQELPESVRLIYQLHLEGLINDEIAFILNYSDIVVASAIEESKSFMGKKVSGSGGRQR